MRPPNGVRVHVSGIDLIRDDQGEFRVLEDNVRVPSGVSYVMTNRRAISVRPARDVRRPPDPPVAGYPQRLLAALRAAAPAGVTDPTVVVLTPGVYNGAYFEHALLARTMGVELVEGRDLECRRGRVMMRTTKGLAPVHVIYRRVDDEFLDPVHFRADSMLGCPGLIDAARAGNVTIANAVGNGVADDKLVYTYLPDLIRYYLGEEPILKNVDTWRVGDAEAREEVLDRLDELVLKPVDGSGGKGIVIGPRATAAELDELRAKILADPRSWIAQPVVQLSTVPTLRRRQARAAARRPAPVRGQRRPARVGAARRPDPGRPRRGRADRELLARRRLQGHLGARRHRPHHQARGARARRTRPLRRRPRRRRPARPSRTRGPARSNSSSSSRAVDRRRADAEPDRGVDVLDRPLRRARRGHRAHPRRADPAAARGHGIDERETCRMLLSIMGVDLEPEDDVDVTTVLRLLAYDPESPTSIAAALGAARESARRARETLSVPMWEAINTTYRAIPSGQFRSTRPPMVFQWVRERAALINGTADATMTRDEGWQFLMLGRCIERADMTSRLVATAAGLRAARRGRARCARAAATRRSCAPTAASRPSGRPRSSCCSTGCSRGRWSSRSTAPSSASTTSSRPASGPASRTRRSGCSAAPAPSSSTARSPTSSPTCRTRWSACSAPARWRPTRSPGATSPAPSRSPGRGCCREHAAADRAHDRRSSTTAARSRRTTRPG